MRLVHVVHRYYPHVGGSEEVVREISERLSERGHDVHVLARWSPRGAFGDVGGVEVHPFRNPLEYLKSLRDLSRSANALMFYGYWNAKWLPLVRVRAPVVYFPVAFDYWTHALSRLYYETWQRLVCRMADVLVAITKDQQRFLRSWVRHPRIVWVPNGIDFDYWQGGEPEANEGRPFVFYSGGYYPHKRVEDLLRVLSAINESDRIRLVACGPDPEGRAERIGRTAEKMGVGEDVTLLGNVERPRLRSYYHGCSVYVSASDFEGFGLTFLEALACGKPVVCRPVGVAPELAAQTSNVVMADDLESFASGIRQFMQEGHNAAESRELARSYDWERAVDVLESVYESLT